MKKVKIFLYIIILSLFLGCPIANDTQDAQDDGVQVGIILPSSNDPRWSYDGISFLDSFDDLGYKSEVLYSENNLITEQEHVKTFIDKQVQVLIITPVDYQDSSADLASDAGIKIISYDRLLCYTENVDYYSTFSAFDVGVIQGQYLIDNVTGTGNNLYLYSGAKMDNNAYLFLYGSWSVLQPKILDGTFIVQNSPRAIELMSTNSLTWDEVGSIVNEISTEWDYVTAGELATTNLENSELHTNEDVWILGPNDGTARAIHEVFANYDDINNICITGQDAEKASIQSIIDQKQTMTVLKDIRLLISDATNVAIQFIIGEIPHSTTNFYNGSIYVPSKPTELIIVDSSTVQEVIFDSGYYAKSDFQF